MTPELWQRLKPLYNAALDLPEAGRADYVEQMCGGNAELAHALGALLAADKSAAHTLDPRLPAASLFPSSFHHAVLAPKTVLADRFCIVRHLGSGGMGDVYEATDLQLEQGRIALKTIRPAIAGNPAALARFKDEVRLARTVTGPHVCRIHELYLCADPHTGEPSAFLTMELLEGQTLHDRIAENSPLPLAEMRSISEQLCAALGCIHEAGIIHRDLKPRNVMLVPHHGAHKVVVMDFGLARAASAAARTLGGDSLGSLSDPGQVVGTPSYMAPEQFEGREVGPATDIYALGLILYELATGVQPFAAHTPLAAAIRRGKAPQTPSTVRSDLPIAWDEVISCCLRYEPEKRFQSTAEVLGALKRSRQIVWRFGHHHRVAISRRLLLLFAVLMAAVALGVTWRVVSAPYERKLSPEVAHWYALGTTALREGSYLKATRLLGMVTERDPGFALAHAALADAWTELDFTDAAEHEMLLASAPKEQRGISERDRRYIDAVRTTLVRDYSAAAQDYEAILSSLPDDTKAQGYVDLGRVYEKAGRTPQAVQAYQKAAAINADDPAAFLHLGILRSRLREPAAAQQAFNRAESLYHAESDLEGLAEVSYQRGYAADDNGAYKEAKQFLEQSLAIARQIPSVQLEVRSLSQLSTLSYNQGQDDAATAFANQAMAVAQENGLEYWTVDALIRLGNAALDKEDFATAEPLYQQALRKARQNGHPRLEAFAELNLASLCNLQKRWDEQIHYAQSALRYYKDYGFMNSADKAETLILRGERDKGEFGKALQAGEQLLGIAASTHSTLMKALAEESVGNVLLRLERYPEALTHFQQAGSEMRTLGGDPSYQQVHIAQALWPLGRFREAEDALGGISAEMRRRNDISMAVRTVQAEMQLSQGNARAALATAEQARSAFPHQLADAASLDRVRILAQVQLGQTVAAAQLLRTQADPSPEEGAWTHYAQALLDMRRGNPAAAESNAAEAQQFFAKHAMAESNALSLLLQAQASQALGNSAAAAAFSQQCVDIFRQIQQSWGAQAFQQYVSRPDRHQSLQALAKLRGANGDLPDELSR